MTDSNTPEVSTNDKRLRAVSTDFGQVFTSSPMGVAQPTRADELQRVVSHCSANNIHVVARGMSHSASGQCLTNQGVVIDTKQMTHIHSLNFDGEKGEVKVDAGITWEALVRHSLKHGATPPVLTDWQKLTVGGTLSTGGLGFMSHVSGVQADSVVSMSVVTGTGDMLECSESENRDLFDLVRGGLGQYGLIATATIQLTKAPKKMHVVKLLISDTAEFHVLMQNLQQQEHYECIHAFLIPHTRAEFLKKLGEEACQKYADELQALEAKSGFSYFVELVKYEYDDTDFALGELPQNDFLHYELDDYFDYVTKEPPLIKTQKEKGITAHPELAVFIPQSTFKAFMQGLLDVHREQDMGEGPVLIIPMTRSLIKPSALVVPEEDFYFVGILRNAYPNTEATVKRLTELNESLYAQALRLGGKRYACDSLRFPSSHQEWQTHFGALWQAVSSGKAKFDPQSTFKSLLTVHTQQGEC